MIQFTVISMNRPGVVLPPVLKSLMGIGMTRKRSLKVWTGLVRVSGKTGQLSANVCAYSQKDAIDLINSFSPYSSTVHELRNYWSDCWGNSMNDIVPERGLWIEYQRGKPERVI